MSAHRLNRLGFAIILAAAAVAVGAPTTGPASDAPTSGRIDAVTVYRGQALVSRVIDVGGAGGVREIVVTDLPERIVAASLFAEADGDVEIRGLRYRNRPVSQDVREDVRQLETKLRDLSDSQAANTRKQQTVGERRAYLDKLESFSASTAGTELKNGVLNAETIKNLTVFLFEQRASLADEELKLRRDARDLGEQIELLNRQLGELTRGATKSIREAVVLVDFKKAPSPLRVRYLVDSATWSPSYVARAESGKAKGAVTVEYNAAV